MSTTQVKGMKELAEFMRQLPDKLEKNVLRGGLRAGAKVLEAEIERTIPVEHGDTRKSIRVSTRSRRGVVTASVKSDAPEAHWLEYGTAAHWIKVRESAKPTRMTRRGKRKVSMKTLNKMLAGGSLKIGTHFVGAAVLHPGAKPHPTFRTALDAKATEAVVAAGNYIKQRLATKHGLDTSGVTVEADEP